MASKFSFHIQTCCCSVAQSCPTLWDPMDCSTPGLPSISISWSLLKLMFIDLVMPSNHLILCHRLLLLPSIFPSIRVFSKESVLHIGGWSLGASSSVIPKHIQGWFLLGWTGWISLQSKGLSGVFSNTTVQKHQFFGTQLSLWSNSHIHGWLLEKPQLWLIRPLLAKWCLCFWICCLGWS